VRVHDRGPVSEGVASVVGMMIDCGRCTARGDACADCVVTFLTIPVGVPDLDEAEQGALEVLASSGMVPPLRMIRAV